MHVRIHNSKEHMNTLKLEIFFLQKWNKKPEKHINFCWFDYFFATFCNCFAFPFIPLCNGIFNLKIIIDGHEFNELFVFFGSWVDEIWLKMIWHVICIIIRAHLRHDGEQRGKEMRRSDHFLYVFGVFHSLSINSIRPNSSLFFWTHSSNGRKANPSKQDKQTGIAKFTTHENTFFYSKFPITYITKSNNSTSN